MPNGIYALTLRVLRWLRLLPRLRLTILWILRRGRILLGKHSRRRWWVLLGRRWISLALCYLLSEIVQFFVNRPLTECENTQHNDINDGDQHQYAQSTTIPCLGENSPINDNGKNDSYQTENDRGKDNTG